MAHDCPGCGLEGVADDMLSCKPCWRRLPVGIKRWVSAAWRAGPSQRDSHTRAVRAAMRWYRDNTDRR